MSKLAFGLFGIAALVAATPAASQGSRPGLMVLRPSSRGLDIRTTLRGAIRRRYSAAVWILRRRSAGVSNLRRRLAGASRPSDLGIPTPTRTADVAGPPSAVREAW